MREIERRAQSQARINGVSGSRASRTLPVHIEDLQRRLGEHLGSKVRIQPGAKKGAGRITIEFFSLDDFEGLLGRLGFDPG